MDVGLGEAFGFAAEGEDLFPAAAVEAAALDADAAGFAFGVFDFFAFPFAGKLELVVERGIEGDGIEGG